MKIFLLGMILALVSCARIPSTKPWTIVSIDPPNSSGTGVTRYYYDCSNSVLGDFVWSNYAYHIGQVIP